jgi:hypothetical protein
MARRLFAVCVGEEVADDDMMMLNRMLSYVADKRCLRVLGGNQGKGNFQL